MKEETLKRLIDICFVAKKVTETMEPLIDNLKPRHIHVIDTIYEIQKQNKTCCVSDISGKFNITTPSVTKLVNELEQKGIVTKYPSCSDKRVTLIKLTDKGIMLEKKYVTDYHKAWIDEMLDISEEDAQTTISVVTALYNSIPKGKNGKKIVMYR